ncbi:hypothetical protein MLD38_027017 [Melastoma candidum]|uniref:Uncharacterized protein n=1 Tax=Melastoma candidum TaxID=119954 RepID=A0ACB9P6K9_9MYRT|nr:hypothetical protein MLD38_027017 [Melastoma candidum]
MDEKRRDSGSSSSLPPPSSDPTHASESVSTRRRAGALKRKASAAFGSSGHGNAGSPSYSSPTPSKRASREKSSSATPHSQIQNGPLTRARQSGPGSHGGERLSAKEVAAAVAVKAEEERKAEAEEARKAAEALEAAIEAEFERISSRSTNVHVVPNHCGWFSWTKVHPLEEHSLPSFFNGKTENRTPGVYMDIRNMILRNFHSNPNIQIELKDLSDLEVGDSEARREVLEFLDYWGLINFHPFPESHATEAGTESKGVDKKDLLIDKLYQFDKIQPAPVASPSDSLSTQQVSSGLFSEALMADELSKAEGPSVEYHCNSCSADCSRKRYHCQKQADFDLCTDCFNGGKFGSNMSSLDFILMEPADAPGAIGEKWTDQETLLLLEAIELFQDNWSEIAEHVATKTKAQCMLHFLQMPIEDVFLDCDGDMDVNKGGDVNCLDNNVSVTGDIPESTISKVDTSQGETEKSPMETSNSEDICEQNADTQPSNQDAIDPKEVQENMDDVKEKDENIIVKTLRESFEAVSCSSMPDGCLSFSEAGNPVMAMAEFLSQLVGSDFASAFLRGSLKSIGEGSTGIQLAMKHCFIMEDPPDQAELNLSQSDFDKSEEKQKVDIDKSCKDGKDHSNGDNGRCNASPILEEKGEDTEMSDSRTEKVENSKESQPNSLGQSSGTGLGVWKEDATDGEPSTGSKEVDVSTSPSALESTDQQPRKPNLTVSGEDAKINGSDMEHDDKNKEPIASNKSKQPEKSVARVSSLLLDKPECVPDSLTTENGDLQPTLAANEENDDKALKVIDQNDSLVAESNCSIDKLKRAAASALSAATVKARLLAEDEEDQIRRLTVFLIDKQLRKLEAKLAFFNDLDHVIARVREQFDRLRQRLYQERAQIIASRLGAHAASGPRGMLPTLSANRVAMNFANLGPRAAASLPSLRPPISRTMSNVSPNPQNTFVSTSTAGS